MRVDFVMSTISPVYPHRYRDVAVLPRTIETSGSDHAVLNLSNWAPTHVSDSQVRVVVKVTRRAVSIERI